MPDSSFGEARLENFGVTRSCQAFTVRLITEIILFFILQNNFVKTIIRDSWFGGSFYTMKGLIKEHQVTSVAIDGYGY